LRLLMSRRGSGCKPVCRQRAIAQAASTGIACPPAVTSDVVELLRTSPGAPGSCSSR
jgi:hypothetical protein